MVRGHIGKFLAITTGPIDRTVSTIYSELIATRCAVGLIKSSYPNGVNVKFQGDSNVVMVAMKGKWDDYSVWGSIKNDLRFFLSGLSNVECSHIQREGNSAAQRLARMSLGVSQKMVWFDEPPYLIQDILFEEGL